MHTLCLQGFGKLAVCLVEEILPSARQPEQAQAGVKTRWIRKDCLKNIIFVHELTTDCGTITQYVVEQVQVHQSNAQCLPATHRETGNGSVIRVGNHSKSLFDQWDDVFQ